MDNIVAIKFNDFCLVAASGMAAQYYIKLTDNEEKVVELDSHKLLVAIGEDGPRKRFGELIRANLALNKVRSHGQQADATTAANFIRNTLARAIRDRETGPYEVQSLLACYDLPVSEHDDTPAGTRLYYLDYMGTMQQVPYGAHGYCHAFVTALLDCHYRPDMTPQEGVDLLQKCIDEIKRRLIVSCPNFICRVINKDGIAKLEHVK